MLRSAATRVRWVVMAAALAACAAVFPASPSAQGLGGAGTIRGTIKDATGGVLPGVTVTLSNAVSRLSRETVTDSAGKFVFQNVPQNNYHLAATLAGFATFQKDLEVRSGVPLDMPITLALAGASTTVEVVGHADLVEKDSTAHTDVDQTLIEKLPTEASSGLNRIVMMASPGVVADSNSFFHPIGDHAQTQFSIDNQPVTDQQSRVYSNQISADAVDSMEIITGVAPAEYGDKSSLVVHIVTKSGLDQRRPAGSVSFGYGSFTSPSLEANVGVGSKTFGNFLSASGMSTNRYLDPPEFTAIHDHGHNESIFDRLDLKTSASNTLHVDVHVAGSSFDVPDTLDATSQNQHQNINSVNVAPGYSAVINDRTLFTTNGFVRRDQLTYQPSSNIYNDLPATVSQNRSLTNVGGKADLTYTAGVNNIKIGGTLQATQLNEQFTFGITDPTFNSPCVDANGNAIGNTSLTSTSQCTGMLSVNPTYAPNLLPFDLTRKGSMFSFNGSATINEQAVYAQDDISKGNATFKLGLRYDHYAGLTNAQALEPRLGMSYSLTRTATVLRASYGRTMETPYNENLLLSSGFGTSSQLVGTSSPLVPGRRDQIETGVQQQFGHWLVADVGYFNKHTKNGYDFNVLFNTPIVFPVEWAKSRINGFTGRVDLVEHGGFSAFVVMAHTNAIFSPPATGGVLLNCDGCTPPGDFRIDHDQKFNSTTNLQYTIDKPHAVWTALSWRYDSGLVAGSVPDYATALTLTPDQQAAIGLYCGTTFATISAPLSSCNSSVRGATRVIIPADGAENDVTNPPRIAPRSLFDLSFGADNLLNTKKAKLKLRLSIVNLTNKEALYNFLSTFSGTHFVTPRAYTVTLGITF
jgi:hypothetical protein